MFLFVKVVKTIHNPFITISKMYSEFICFVSALEAERFKLEACSFGNAEHEVHVLEGGSGLSLHEVVDDRSD